MTTDRCRYFLWLNGCLKQLSQDTVMAGSWGRDVLEIRGVVGHLCISRQVAWKEELALITPFIMAGLSIGKVVSGYCDAWKLRLRYHPRNGCHRTLHDDSINSYSTIFRLRILFLARKWGFRSIVWRMHSKRSSLLKRVRKYGWYGTLLDCWAKAYPFTFVYGTHNLRVKVRGRAIILRSYNR